MDELDIIIDAVWNDGCYAQSGFDEPITEGNAMSDEEAKLKIQDWAIATLKEVLGEKELETVFASKENKIRNQFRQTILKDFTKRIKGE